MSDRLTSLMAAGEGNRTRPHDRFTNRLEAFSDLVFGFSLSLLATRLDVPSTPEGILDKSKGVALLVTFALICVLWVQHSRVFQHHFVAHQFDVVVNFLFLFGLALLPYVLQTFIRFQLEPSALLLYLGDLSLIFTALATLQLRGLLRRDPEMNDGVRLREFRRTVIQYVIVVVMVVTMVLVGVGRVRIASEIPVGIMLFPVIGARRLIRNVPSFLRPATQNASLTHVCPA